MMRTCLQPQRIDKYPADHCRIDRGGANQPGLTAAVLNTESHRMPI
jgi:hypothetical protein